MAINNSPPIIGSKELVIQTIAMPAATNALGDIFGGWILSQMDLGGALLAKKTCKNKIVTVAIDAMKFHKPVRVGDVVSCYASVVKIGRTSVAIKVEVWITPFESEGALQQVTEGVFTYVCIDEKGVPKPIPR